ncbi:hypothetical protein ABPG72_020319 [Tetrahymena utriculariae]
MKTTSENNKQSQIIMNNVLQLAQMYNKGNQRNLLNKWFQDSIKNYVLESIAFPLIGKFLRCESSSSVKKFIEKNIDKTKPKYMSIMDQYFYQINKYNKGQEFKEKLQNIVQNPKDYSVYQFQQTYTNEKEIRKQFVCYLILSYFEQYGNQDFPSFYELWNFCFPQKIQIKRKLSRFDPKIFTKRQNLLLQKDTGNQGFSSNNQQNSNTFIPVANKKNNQNQDPQLIQKQTVFQTIDHSDQPQKIEQEGNHYNNNINLYPQKKQINNHIFEDYQEEQEQFLNNSQQFPFYQENANIYEQNMCLQNEGYNYNNQQIQFKDFNDQYFFDFEIQNSYQPIYQPHNCQLHHQLQLGKK